VWVAVAKDPGPPDTIRVDIVGPNGEVTDSLSFKIKIDATPPVQYDDQSWTEAVAFDEFFAAIREPNGNRCRAAMHAFDRLECWDSIWLRLCRVDVDDAFRQNFRSRVVESGFRFRQSVRNLTDVIAAFRHLLPRYTGLHLYRGELASKYNQGDIGFSWTASIKVARMFKDRRISVDGEPGLLLDVFAPAEAIIASPDSHSNWLQEYEYIVDPRALKDIQVIE
jgi:hypothetical protein